MRRKRLIFNDAKAIYDLLQDKQATEYIDTMGLTTKDIEGFCQSVVLEVRQGMNDYRIENEKKPPLMATHFFYYLYMYQQMPTPKAFAEFYFALNQKWVKENIDKAQKEGLEARIARFYASIVREFHFYHLVKESNMFDKVSYTLKMDIENKIDVLVEKEGLEYGLQLRVGTNNSTRYAAMKSKRGFAACHAHLIDFPIDLGFCKNVDTQGDTFKFYDDRYLAKLATMATPKCEQKQIG